MNLSVQSYLSLSVILISLVVIVFGARKYSKFVDNENFIFENYGGILRGAVSSAIMVVVPIFAILISEIFFVYSIGVPFGTNQEMASALMWPFVLTFVVPLFVICIASALKTKRLAKNGHKLAGYLTYAINPRFNLLKMLYASGLAMIAISVGFWTSTLSLQEQQKNSMKGNLFIVGIILFFVLVGYTDRILHFIMKKLLGKNLNLDYSPLIKRSEREFGISEKEFYEKNFTSKELKWLEKDREEYGK